MSDPSDFDAACRDNDRIILDSICNLLAQDQTEGLNWPGVARLIRRRIEIVEATVEAQAREIERLKAERESETKRACDWFDLADKQEQRAIKAEDLAKRALRLLSVLSETEFFAFEDDRERCKDLFADPLAVRLRTEKA